MSAWLTIPSARPVSECGPLLDLWRKQGYKIALWRDEGCDSELLQPSVRIVAPYPGYAVAVNKLIRWVIDHDPTAEWFVAGGDDVEPDMNHTAEEIAFQCNIHFVELHVATGFPPDTDASPIPREAVAHTFGVMQPTGDRFAEGSIDRICGSPWMGREFCRRIYGGRGPLWEEFTHMFVDEHLQNVALKLGILWQRRDLVHFHRHFMRQTDKSLQSPAQVKAIPPHLVEWNSQEHWAKSKAIFERLKAGGFAEAQDLLP